MPFDLGEVPALRAGGRSPQYIYTILLIYIQSPHFSGYEAPLWASGDF